jgi:hypothetical protein
MASCALYADVFDQLAQALVEIFQFLPIQDKAMGLAAVLEADLKKGAIGAPKERVIRGDRQDEFVGGAFDEIPDLIGGIVRFPVPVRICTGW